MKDKISRRDVKKLAPEIVAEFHAAGQAGDVEAFKRLLGKWGSHLSKEVKDNLIEDFKRNAAALRAALREKH